jgi:hypothetical protein
MTLALSNFHRPNFQSTLTKTLDATFQIMLSKVEPYFGNSHVSTEKIEEILELDTDKSIVVATLLPHASRLMHSVFQATSNEYIEVITLCSFIHLSCSLLLGHLQHSRNAVLCSSCVYILHIRSGNF